MGDNSAKPWKKTEDIPRRFDELPPEPGWVPVAEVIRTSREDEAKKEAQKEKFKIKPPVDSDSESSDTEVKHGNRSKEKAPIHKENEEKRMQTPSKKLDDTSMPPTVDNVTQSMVEWALSPDHYPRKKPKSLTHHKDEIKPLVEKQKPSPLLQGKSYAAKESPSYKQPSKTSTDGSRSHASPQKDYNSQSDVLSSPSGHQSRDNLPGAPTMRPKQPTSNQKEQRPPYDEPSPDYDDEDDNAYYSRHDEQYYVKERPDEDVYYYDEYGYEDRGTEDPYFSGAASPYNEYPPYPHQQGYPNPQGVPGYEYGEPQYLYEGRRSSYTQLSPYYEPTPQEHPRGRPQPRSSYDVLY